MNASAWRTTFAATALMALAMGGRSSFGLFVSPLNSATGLGLPAISFAAALGQLASGLMQPAIGTLAERHGAARLVTAGALVLAGATAGLVAAASTGVLTMLFVLVAVAGATVGSNAILVGEVGRRVPAVQLGLAAGIVSAGGSAGQLVLGPATQWLIGLQGWVAALWGTAALSFAALPLAWTFARPSTDRTPVAVPPAAAVSVNATLRDPRFWWVAAPFGVCGFHVAFLTTHMPGVIERCGLPSSLAGTWLAIAGAANITGSLAVGVAMKRWASPVLMAALYVARALSILVLLAVPASATAMLAFAVSMGLTYMAMLPPTAQLVGALFGTQRLSTLFGVVMVVHQLGGFAGVWLGGLAAAATGSDTALWAADLVLALIAAALQWPWLRRAR